MSAGLTSHIASRGGGVDVLREESADRDLVGAYRDLVGAGKQSGGRLLAEGAVASAANPSRAKHIKVRRQTAIEFTRVRLVMILIRPFAPTTIDFGTRIGGMIDQLLDCELMAAMLRKPSVVQCFSPKTAKPATS